MKKILPTIIILALVATPLSAKKRVKTADEIPDSYGDNETVTEIKVEKSKKTKSKDVSSDPYNEKKMKGAEYRTGAQRAFNLNKFQKIESFSLYARNVFGKFKARKAHLIHRAGTDIGGFVSYYDTSAYALQFSTQARAIVRSAIEQYLKDFDEKKLDRKAKKTERIYGKCDAYEDFGMAIDMMQDYSKPRVNFGYLFVKENPYFVIHVPKAKNLKATRKNEYDTLKENVIEQRYYFTKAQANRLYTFLSDENISALKGALKNEALDEDEIRADSFDANTTEGDSSETKTE